MVSQKKLRAFAALVVSLDLPAPAYTLLLAFEATGIGTVREGQEVLGCLVFAGMLNRKSGMISRGPEYESIKADIAADQQEQQRKQKGSSEEVPELQG